jgi:hypothetical protein
MHRGAAGEAAGVGEARSLTFRTAPGLESDNGLARTPRGRDGLGEDPGIIDAL